MKDEEDIIKALECCGKHSCKGCPYNENTDDLDISCIIKLSKDTFYLINRQKAEIERYEKTCGKLVVKDGEVIALLNGKETIYIEKAIAEQFKRMGVKEAKAETVKEFLERLKEKATDIGVCDAQGNNYGGATVVFVNDIEDIAKEMGCSDNV